MTASPLSSSTVALCELPCFLIRGVKQPRKLSPFFLIGDTNENSSPSTCCGVFNGLTGHTISSAISKFVSFLTDTLSYLLLWATLVVVTNIWLFTTGLTFDHSSIKNQNFNTKDTWELKAVTFAQFKTYRFFFVFFYLGEHKWAFYCVAYINSVLEKESSGSVWVALASVPDYVWWGKTGRERDQSSQIHSWDRAKLKSLNAHTVSDLLASESSSDAQQYCPN